MDDNEHGQVPWHDWQGVNRVVLNEDTDEWPGARHDGTALLKPRFHELTLLQIGPSEDPEHQRRDDDRNQHILIDKNVPLPRHYRTILSLFFSIVIYMPRLGIFL